MHARAHMDNFGRVDSSKRTITAEDLLIWSYRDQMVHAARGEMVPAELARDYALGIGGGGFKIEHVDGGARVDFGAHDDAYRVHEAVQALSPVSIAVSPDVLQRQRRDNVLAGEVETSARLRVDRRHLVFLHAVGATRPDWIRTPKLRMKPGDVVLHPRNRRPWFCKIEPDGDSQAEVDRARAVYAAWVEALEKVAACLDGMLCAHVLTGQFPPAQPWLLPQGIPIAS